MEMPPGRGSGGKSAKKFYKMVLSTTPVLLPKWLKALQIKDFLMNGVQEAPSSNLGTRTKKD
jgi:hypothetical protein